MTIKHESVLVLEQDERSVRPLVLTALLEACGHWLALPLEVLSLTSAAGAGCNAWMRTRSQMCAHAAV